MRRGGWWTVLGLIVFLAGCESPTAPSSSGRVIDTIGGGSLAVSSFVPIACPPGDCYVDETGTRWREQPNGTWDAYCEECWPGEDGVMLPDADPFLIQLGNEAAARR